MGEKIMYLIDPKNNLKSVTLTFLVISYALLVAASVLQAGEFIKSVGYLPELFYSCSALYFGRRVQVGSKIFSSEADKK
jgi:hypothetical protein